MSDFQIDKEYVSPGFDPECPWGLNSERFTLPNPPSESKLKFMDSVQKEENKFKEIPIS
jgi:hypothetical protein